MDAAALLCNICPKRPRFSDVSHLLTHVSSKAHLSHYFKLQVRSHQESEAGGLLDEYDRWYKVNNLAKLLSDRMASKEARQKKRQGKAAAQGATCPTKKDPGPKVTPDSCTSPHASLPNFLDPRLSHPYSNVGQIVGNADPPPPSASYITPAMSSIGDDDDKAHIRLDRPLPPVGSPERSEPRQWKTDYDSDSGDEAGSILHATPRWPGGRGLDARDEIDPRLLHGDLGSDPFIDGNDSFENLPGHEIDKERADEIARLKGVLWPGMDIFDSATEQMRRKRNQKKDESVLKKMEKTSLCVEPTELVFSPSGILRKQRVINGNVEDSSPLKGETPIPKRRAVRPKRLLFSETDPNIAPRRGQERKRTKKDTSRPPNRPSEEPTRRPLRAARDAVSRLPVCHRGGYRSSSLGDGNDEIDLSFKGFDQRSRSGFTVFHDDQDQYNSCFKDQRQGDGSRFGPSNSSHPHFPRRETMGFGPFQSPTTNGYAPKFAGRAACHATGKENVEPILNVHGRIDTPESWRSPFAKRTYTGDTGYPPHYFFGDAPRPGFGPFDTSHDLSGYSWNPLAVSLPRLPVQENRIYNADTSPNYDPPSVTRAASPNGTISDAEQDDFERLYLDGSSY